MGTNWFPAFPVGADATVNAEVIVSFFVVVLTGLLRTKRQNTKM
uniref:Uncharacterized protein n=1 Tax=Arundo donax TaxID=35708 RepID=A0A0A9GTZ7_ARUDO